MNILRLLSGLLFVATGLLAYFKLANISNVADDTISVLLAALRLPVLVGSVLLGLLIIASISERFRKWNSEWVKKGW